ncbi:MULTISPECIES: hypothetical protein [unclassified Prochlorococcus]|uniref:hypothetical protein n=1 Tax=unclassified Prochlorococcus TaxID=2627481 RepID=UPI00053393FE|nr:MULTISPECIES: hypothetical protein [unclassified Prochlorococcus]KGG28883.1 hypothetical protein EV13_1396 [Prochlorococcus sp. MIT 0702]
MIEQFSVVVVSVESSNCFKGVILGLGVLPPRLLQDHSLSGEPYCIALVKHRNSSGELLVNCSDPSQSLEVKLHSQ